MDDLARLSASDLDARLRDGIARRLDAIDARERARAGADLIAVLLEVRRRDAAHPARDGRPGQARDGARADVRTLQLAPRRT